MENKPYDIETAQSASTQSEPANDSKTYEPPVLRELGTLLDLTQSSAIPGRAERFGGSL